MLGIAYGEAVVFPEMEGATAYAAKSGPEARRHLL